MRSSKTLLLAGMATIVAVLTMALGCSDDSTPTYTPPPVENNGIESLLGVVQDQVHAYLDSAITATESALRVATYVDVGTDDIGSGFMGPVIPDSTRGDKYWIVSFATDLQAGAGTMSIVDSLTYVVDGKLSVNAKGADAMYVKHNYGFQSLDTNVTYTDIVHHGFLHITGIDGTTATINGDFVTTIDSKVVTVVSTVWDNWTLEVTVTNLAVDRDGDSWTTGCPGSGNCTVGAAYEHAEDQDIPTTTNWNLDITFTDGNMAVDVTTGNLNTSYEHTLCTP
jgi:hypothetical protein